MLPQEFKATARESAIDPRTYVHDLAGPVTYTKGGVDYLPNEIENQHKVGICTAISLVQNAEKALGKKYSPDFLYLLGKKYFDGDWEEGSSIFTMLKAAKKYGFLPEGNLVISEADRVLPYDQYIAKLRAIPDTTINSLLALCEKKLTGYASVDVSTKENIAHAIDSSRSGILCRYTITDRWWLPSWNGRDISPLEGDGNAVGGHAITASQYDYTNGVYQTLANTWSSLWGYAGSINTDYSNYKMTEAWIPYYDTAPVATPKFTQYLVLGSTGSEVKMLQARLGVIQTGYFGTLTQNAVKAFQFKNGITQTGTVGPVTRAKLNQPPAGEALPNNNIQMNSHTLRTLTYLAVIFIIGGLKAAGLDPSLTAYAPIIMMIISVFAGLEHLLKGNTSTN